jgi:hypothetical protein
MHKIYVYFAFLRVSWSTGGAERHRRAPRRLGRRLLTFHSGARTTTTSSKAGSPALLSLAHIIGLVLSLSECSPSRDVCQHLAPAPRPALAGRRGPRRRRTPAPPARRPAAPPRPPPPCIPARAARVREPPPGVDGRDADARAVTAAAPAEGRRRAHGAARHARVEEGQARGAALLARQQAARVRGPHRVAPPAQDPPRREPHPA